MSTQPWNGSICGNATENAIERHEMSTDTQKSTGGMTYAIKTRSGYLATQGREHWFQDAPNGWAAFCTADDARRIAEAQGRRKALHGDLSWVSRLSPWAGSGDDRDLVTQARQAQSIVEADDASPRMVRGKGGRHVGDPHPSPPNHHKRQLVQQDEQGI